MLTDEKKYGKMKTDKRLPYQERLPKCFSLVNRQLLDERAVYFFIATTNNKIIVR